ncbi:hypothetical protein O9992_27240 [Vibrio lentus]|nr:hypothetical protein [Vibrio lentus]
MAGYLEPELCRAVLIARAARIQLSNDERSNGGVAASKTTKGSSANASTSTDVDGVFDERSESVCVFQYVFEVFHLFYSPLQRYAKLNMCCCKKE